MVQSNTKSLYLVAGNKFRIYLLKREDLMRKVAKTERNAVKVFGPDFWCATVKKIIKHKAASVQSCWSKTSRHAKIDEMDEKLLSLFCSEEEQVDKDFEQPSHSCLTIETPLWKEVVKIQSIQETYYVPKEIDKSPTPKCLHIAFSIKCLALLHNHRSIHFTSIVSFPLFQAIFINYSIFYD